jgi:hypothetical protein
MRGLKGGGPAPDEDASPLSDFPDDEGDRRRSVPFLTRSVLLSDFLDDEGPEG